MIVLHNVLAAMAIIFGLFAALAYSEIRHTDKNATFWLLVRRNGGFYALVGLCSTCCVLWLGLAIVRWV